MNNEELERNKKIVLRDGYKRLIEKRFIGIK